MSNSSVDFNNLNMILTPKIVVDKNYFKIELKIKKTEK